jgi:hypothetical protein
MKNVYAEFVEPPPVISDDEKKRWRIAAMQSQLLFDKIGKERDDKKRRKLARDRKDLVDMLHREMLVGHGLADFEWEMPGGKTLLLEFDPKGKVGRGTWDGQNGERLRIRVTLVNS